MKKLFFLFVSFLATTCLWAYDFQSGDLYYNITSESNPYTVEVTYEKDFSCYNYNGLTTAIIPEEVTYNGITYSVTSIGKSAFYWCGNLTNITIPNSVTSIGKYAFDLCSSLIDVTLNSNEICGKSYTQESNISHIFGAQVTKYIIGDNVKRIGEYAFYGCSNLTNVTIGNNVTSIGSYSFSGCSNLTDITIPNSITSIGSDAFKGCSSLTAVYISDIAAWCGITFSSNPLSDAHNLYLNGELVTDLVIPNSVTRIASSAFKGYSKLNSVTIPNSVTSIGDYTFSGCKSLINITIGSGVTSIGSYAFNGCSSLTSVILPKKVRSIGLYAFNGCSNLTDITIGNRVTDIYSKAFDNCNSLKEVYISDIAAWCGIEFGSNPLWYGGNLYLNGELVTDLIIPDGVTSIASNAFRGCGSVTSVTFPNSVRSIGMRTFESCSSLTSVAIPNSVTNIGSDAFNGCSSLTNIIIPNSITSIEDYAFAGCSSLTAVTIPSSVTSIGYGAFSGCSTLTNIIIPNSITSIEKYAFDGCSSLTDVTLNSNVIVNKSYKRDSNISHIFGPQVTSYIIGDDVQSIGASAFNNSSKLLNVTIGKNVTSIGDYAFTDCALTSVTIPDSVTNIGKCTFYNCSGLAVATIGNGVTSIGEEAFEHCKSLTTVTIGNSVTNIKSKAFNGCSSLTNVTLNSNDIVGKSYTQKSNISHIFGSQVTNYIIGDSVTSIGEYAFSDCSSLTSVTIGESVTSIGAWAFSDCSSLTSVTIGESVTSIGAWAFDDCFSLTSITCEAETPPTVGDNAFYYVSKSIPVYVPCGCVEAYKVAYGWKYFTNIQGPLAEYSIEVDVNDNIMGTAKVDINSSCDTRISATANYGYYFVQWSDGNTENPRTLELTQDTILTAEFAQSFSGQCGDSLYWELVDTTLHITGKGEMYDYKSNTAPWKLLVSSIKSLSVSEGTTSIGDGAFYYCSSLTSVTIPNSVTSIGNRAFYECSKLTSVTIPNKVTSIGEGAFYHCSSLTSVTIPNSVTSIGKEAFFGCSSLTKTNYTGDIAGWCNIKFCDYDSNPMEWSNNFFINDQEIKDLVIPNNVMSIGDYAFSRCSGLTAVTIPNSVTSIGISAFLHCSGLTSVTIPNSVTSLGKEAFAYCSSLTTLVCKATEIPNTAVNVFDYSNIVKEDGLTLYATLYVPKASLNKYKSTAPWKYFNLILPIEDSGDDPSNPDDEEDDGALTCAEAVAICQETGTTITTEQYTIRGYVTEIKTAYSEQYNNITFWMADTPHGGRVLQAYRVIPVEANDIDVKVGDYVEVIGSLVNYYGTTPEVYTGGIYTILPKQEENGSTTEEEYITACDSYEWHGETYTESGDYTYTTITENGCEHVEILHLTIYKSEYVETSITACDSYDWHGETYTESGDYTYTTTTENGCERVEILHLMITPSNPEDNSKDSITVKAKIPAHWTDDISAWIWGATSSGHWVTPTKEDDWYVITEDVEELNIIFVNGTNWSGYKNQTIDMTFTANACIQLAQEGSAKATYTAIDCESNDTPKDDEEDDGVITCAEAVSICQETGTTITTEQYTICGYVTYITSAYSEQYNNITFWMADISPTQMDNSSNSVTSLSDYPNIALGKSTTASSSEDSGTLPEYINDGDFNTRWSSEWQDNEYITIDLEQYSFIDHITLHWETAYASQFAILITDEQPSSSTLSSPLPSSATYYQSSGDVQTIPVAKSGRYITLIGIERATAYGISLYELEAYGMPLLQAYCVKPIQSTDKYVQIGDYVEAVGTLVNYGGTTPEINAGGTYTILTKHEENGSTTSVENTNTQSSMTNCQKILYEDHIYILREDKIYSVMGQEL